MSVMDAMASETVSASKLKVKPEDFELLRVLGKGGYGKVSTCPVRALGILSISNAPSVLPRLMLSMLRLSPFCVSVRVCALILVSCKCCISTEFTLQCVAINIVSLFLNCTYVCVLLFRCFKYARQLGRMQAEYVQ
jgi:hypothetical protein